MSGANDSAKSGEARPGSDRTRAYGGRVVTRRPSAFRQSDLTRAVKAVIAAGLHVVSIKVSAQGDIEVLTDDERAQDSATQGGNEWDAIS
jgi:hypothetical protein